MQTIWNFHFVFSFWGRPHHPAFQWGPARFSADFVAVFCTLVGMLALYGQPCHFMKEYRHMTALVPARRQASYENWKTKKWAQRLPFPPLLWCRHLATVSFPEGSAATRDLAVLANDHTGNEAKCRTSSVIDFSAAIWALPLLKVFSTSLIRWSNWTKSSSAVGALIMAAVPIRCAYLEKMEKWKLERTPLTLLRPILIWTWKSYGYVLQNLRVD